MSFVELLICWFKLNLMNTDQEPWILILWPLSIARLRTQDSGWFCKTFYIIWNLQRCSRATLGLFSSMHCSTRKLLLMIRSVTNYHQHIYSYNIQPEAKQLLILIQNRHLSITLCTIIFKYFMIKSLIFLYSHKF